MKTEKEKMLSGELYDPEDPQLIKDRNKAKRLCREFNNLATDKINKRKDVIKELFSTEKECYIEPTFYCDYGYNINIGDNFYANHNCVILDVNKVHIGDNVLFGPAVQIYTATHPLQAEQRNAGRELGFPITIGNNVWVGGGAIITPGTTIGDNAVIAAGSVVSNDVPENVVVGGNPAKIIRKIDNS